MKKAIAVLFGVLAIALFSAAAYAADKDAAENETGEADDAAPAKNMTYGQCVSENAVVKNTCYSTVKSSLAGCREQAAQDAASQKNALKQCSADYKKDKKQCKVEFKASKRECAKIKHNFFETIGSAFK